MLNLNSARNNSSDREFTYEEVKNIIKSLLNRKAAGLDSIFNELLKSAGRSMIMALVDVLNLKPLIHERVFCMQVKAKSIMHAA